ncbi:MAG TPA: hypothetical protein VFC63_23145 [Blastocatellia bacterium]|nr:hypothetical protein [Blastocatellia bacterium]
MRYSIIVSKMLSAILLLAIVTDGQGVKVNLGKPLSPIPKICEGVVPASVEGDIDIPALVKEAACKGAGDALTEFTYNLKNTKRERNKKGEAKEESTLFEVYLPTLKNGTSASGILLAVSHNGVPVDSKELEKERRQAGERLEKEEEKIAHKSVPASNNKPTDIKGMHPIGSYSSFSTNSSVFGFSRGSARLGIGIFLSSCDLKLIRQEQVEGRETLVFSFAPRADAKLDEAMKYISQLKGEIWIDKQDRIVSKLVGWPASSGNAMGNAKLSDKIAPPIYVDMIRLPDGTWLPHIMRLNAADYPTLFDRVSADSTVEFSDYKRFVTEAKQEK